MKTLFRRLQTTFLLLVAAMLVSACGGGDATPPPETEAPTMHIESNVIGTATGPVTFTITFSEDVGGSFSADDVAVTNGSRGDFAKLSTLQYTLVVVPDVNKSGVLSLNIAAGSFTDLNGNPGVAASASQAFDTLPPVVTITSSAAGSTATGDVTFNFSFSKDVGATFTTEDVTVSNGTKGAFSRASGTSASLVVTPPANATGTIEVSVPAMAVADSAGTGNAVAASAQQAFNTTGGAVGQGTVLLSFDETPPAFTDMGAYGGALPSVEPGPAGGSGNALKILKPVSPDTWGGVYFTVARIPFTADRKIITARANATRAGAVIWLKVEVPGGSSVEVAGTATGAANTWTTVTWDLSAVDVNLAYTLMAITPDVDRVTDGQAYYIDDITLAPATPVTPPPTGGTVLLSFDETPPAFTDMGAYGGAMPSVEAGPAGGSGNALKILKPTSPDTWGGVYFTVARIPFTADRKKITARVNATRAGAVIRLKVEVPGGSSVEVAGTATGAANTWGTVTWDFSAANVNLSYTVMAITPDADRVTDGQSYYIDDITLAPAEVVTPPVPGAVFLSFDENPPAFSEMGSYGGALPTVEPGPAGGSGNALKILKPASPDTWGGVFFTTARIPFTTTAKKITAKVNSTRAGAVIRFKVEVPGGVSVEVDGTPTGAANTCGTVSWDFSAVDLSQSYKIMAITPEATRVTDGQVYFIDDIAVVESGGGGVTPPPGGEMGSGGPQTLTVATGDVKTGDGGNTMFVAGEGLFSVNYVGSAETTPPFNLAAWPNARTANFSGITGISGGSIGYFQDDVNLSNSSQKVDEGGWVSGTSLAPDGVPNFFRYFVLKGPVSSDAYMGLYLNAPNNGTVNVSSFGKIKIKVWGPAPMFERDNFNPVLEVTLTGPKVAGCTTGSGGSEITQNLTANLKNGAGGFYTMPLSGFTVKGLCCTDTGAANVLANLARVVVTVPGTSFNYTNIDGGNYTTGLNLGPVGFTNR